VGGGGGGGDQRNVARGCEYALSMDTTLECVLLHWDQRKVTRGFGKRTHSSVVSIERTYSLALGSTKGD